MTSTSNAPNPKRRSRSLISASVLTLWVIAACSSSSDERERAAGLAGGCLLNSDCDEKRICIFARCHKPCDEDRDCEGDLRCVKDEETGAFGCLLDDEMICKEDRHCPKGLLCGVDHECRYACETKGDCIDTQICDQSGHCASTDPGKDELDANNQLVPAPPTAIGGTSGGGQSGGGTGNAGTAGTDVGTAGTDVGAGGTDLGAGGTGGSQTMDPVAGAGGDTSPGAAGQGGETSSGTDFEEEPGPELVDNDAWQQAVAVTTFANLYLEEGDQDWLKLSTADDGRAHIITVRVEQESSVTSGLTVLAGADRTQIGAAGNFSQGTLRYVYVTVGPATTTYFGFHHVGVSSSKGMIFVTFEDAPENDVYEPNNQEEDAVLISTGQTVSGQLVRPYVSEFEAPLVDDWFEIDLVAGEATFQLLSVPNEGRFYVERKMGGVTEHVATTTPNQTGAFPLSKSALLPGRHAIRIMPYSVDVRSYANYIKPSYMAEQYSFSITQ